MMPVMMSAAYCSASRRTPISDASALQEHEQEGDQRHYEKVLNFASQATMIAVKPRPLAEAVEIV